MGLIPPRRDGGRDWYVLFPHAVVIVGFRENAHTFVEAEGEVQVEVLKSTFVARSFEILVSKGEFANVGVHVCLLLQERMMTSLLTMTSSCALAEG